MTINDTPIIFFDVMMSLNKKNEKIRLKIIFENSIFCNTFNSSATLKLRKIQNCDTKPSIEIVRTSLEKRIDREILNL